MNENKQEQRKITNYEKIKNMSVEEMEKYFYKTNGIFKCLFCAHLKRNECLNVTCLSGIKEYLESEVTEE